MKEFIKKLIGRLEELYARNDKTKKMAYEEQDWEKFDLFTHRCEGIYSAISIVNQLAEEYNNGWISCSERLPELTEGTECFKQSPCCLTTLKWWDGDMTESVGWYNQSGVWNEDSKNCKVIAWMPLPPAYVPKEGRE